MTKSKDALNHQTGRGSWRFLIMLALVSLLAAAGTMVKSAGARPRPDGRPGQDDKKGFQPRNEDDWDDRDNDHRHAKYAIGLWGDMPYSEIQAAAIPNLIDDMNSQDLAFTVHDGDLKAGKGTPGVQLSTCDDAMYLRALGFFNSLKAPAIFTTGDNDWTDCDAALNNWPNSPLPAFVQFNSLERLDHERALFFGGPYADTTLGQHKLHQAVQTTMTDGKDTTCLGFGAGTGVATTSYTHVACVENRRWTYRGVTYATLDVQGSCNNLCKDDPDATEWAARNAANIAWMQETFEVATKRDSAAVMFLTQADPGWDTTDATRTSTRNPKTLAETDGLPDGFQTFLIALRDASKAFRKPVAYVHGDSHYFRIDKPFYDSAPPDPPASGGSAIALHLENFTRVETFGDQQLTEAGAPADPDDKNSVHWVKVFVDPDSREVFSYQPQTVPANRVVVPAP